MWHAEVAIKVICQTQQIISLHSLCKRLIYFLFFFTAFIFQTALSKNWFVLKKKKKTEGQLFSSDIFFGKCPTLYNRNCGGIIRIETRKDYKLPLTNAKSKRKTKQEQTGSWQFFCVKVRQLLGDFYLFLKVDVYRINSENFPFGLENS